MGSIADWANYASLAGVAGVVVGIWSLTIVFRNVPAARKAAEDARAETRLITTIVDVTMMVPMVEAVGNALVAADFGFARARARDLRQALSRLRAREVKLTPAQRKSIRSFANDLNSLVTDLQTSEPTPERIQNAIEGLGDLSELLAELGEELVKASEADQ